MIKEEIQCPILVPATDYCSSRRCFYLAGDGLCPIHGNIVRFQKYYKKTHILVDEIETTPPKKKPTFQSKLVAALKILFT